MNLKDGAVYQLPNGRELVACLTCDNKTVLFGATDSGFYELNSDGRLLVDGQLTAWQIEDLLETGRVAAPETLTILADHSTAARETTNEQGF